MLEWISSKFGNSQGRGQNLLQQAGRAYEQGAADEARQYCLEVLRRSPDDIGALCLLAAIAADATRVDEGLRWARRALALQPSAVPVHYAMGRLYEAAGRLPEAEASYRKTVELDANHARAFNNLGSVQHMQGKLDAALGCYRRALELDPSQPQANQNFAAIMRDAGAQEAAIQGYLRQTVNNPNDAMAHCNLGKTYADLGRHEEALASFEQALAADPALADAHFSRSLVMLLCGDYAQGWKEFEWRWQINPFNAAARRFREPMWDGRRIDGAMLIHAEHGFGDTLQFVRYAPLVAQRCARVILGCPPQLESLLGNVAGVGSVVASGQPLPEFAAHVPLMSLPRIFGTTLESIPWSGAYIHADPVRAAIWRPLVDSVAAGQFKVGLTWAGNPSHWNDRNRSLAIGILAPLANVRNVAFFSLQVGIPSEESSRPPVGMTLVDLTAKIRDFSDTAAFVSCLDLVISVDTAVAHLAGAMDVPTWVLLARAPDWRHHLARSDNPWYPSMRLFRQQRDGEWPGVIEEVTEALRRQMNK